MELIERYGREATPELRARIQVRLESVSRTLDDLQTVYRHDLAELDRLRSCSCGALSPIDHLRDCPKYSR